jgi:hypothetical protein
MKLMNTERFIDLLEKSVITQMLITVCLVVTVCIMFAMGKPVPDALINFTSIMIGFYVGGKTYQVRKRSE